MTPDEMRDASLLELFRLEAEAQTQVLSHGLMVLERKPTDAAQLEACMRAAHSLKGAARIVGIDAGVRVAHVMEDCLVEAQDGRLKLRPEHIDALLQGADLLLRLGAPPDGDADRANNAGRAVVDGLVARLQSLYGLQRAPWHHLCRSRLPHLPPSHCQSCHLAWRQPWRSWLRSPSLRPMLVQRTVRGCCGSVPSVSIICWIFPASHWSSSSASSR